MKPIASKLLLDSSAWLDYFLASDSPVRKTIESENRPLLTSALSLHEIKRKLLKEKYAKSLVQEVLSFVKSKSIIIGVDEMIAEKSADDSLDHQLHTADSIIYRTAIEQEAELVTFDNHFRQIPKATVLEKTKPKNK